MKNKTLQFLIVLILLSIPLVYAGIVYSDLPETIPTHFDLEGNPNGFGSKSSIFLGPFILFAAGIFTFLMISNLSSIDPKRYKQEDGMLFKKLAFLLVIFLSALGMIIVRSSVAPGNFMIKNLFSMLGCLFIAFGYFMPSISPNYFVGLRLPWTLESEENWKATHKVAGKWWMFGGALQVISGFIFPAEVASILFFIIMAIMVAIPTGFSYLKFKKDQTN
jgi:hypothetical protein